MSHRTVNSRTDGKIARAVQVQRVRLQVCDRTDLWCSAELFQLRRGGRADDELHVGGMAVGVEPRERRRAAARAGHRREHDHSDQTDEKRQRNDRTPPAPDLEPGQPPHRPHFRSRYRQPFLIFRQQCAPNQEDSLANAVVLTPPRAHAQRDTSRHSDFRVSRLPVAPLLGVVVVLDAVDVVECAAVAP